MLKRFTFLLLFLVSVITAIGQHVQSAGEGNALRGASAFDYGNTWYNPTQLYVKLRVQEDGIYHVTLSDLQNASANLTGIDPDNIHLVYRGKEEYIYVKKNGSNLDYFEFYGRRNDGIVDSVMYRLPAPSGIHSPLLQPNKRYSIFSDTSAYYLTWNNNPGLRVTNYSNTNYNLAPEPWFRYESYKGPNFNPADFNRGGGSQFDWNNVLNSDYVMAEGYLSSKFGFGSLHNRQHLTLYAANSGNPSKVTVRIFGRSTYKHIFKLTLRNTDVVILDTIPGIYIRTFEEDYNANLTPTTRFTFEALGTEFQNTDNNNICFSSIKYDRLFTLANQSTIKVEWNKLTDAYFKFYDADVSSGAGGIIWDSQTHTRIVATSNLDTLKAIVPGANVTRNLFVSTDKGIRTPEIVVNPSLVNLSDPANAAEFVIITHSSVLASAQQYKSYRDTNTVNQLSAKVVLVDQIYDEFGYGTITPWAIKRFCKYAMDNWSTPPKFFLLWGKGHYLTRTSPQNLVPTFGYPPCDHEFVSNFDNAAVNLMPESPIGRVSVTNDAEGLNFLKKVDEYEHSKWESWMKKGIFLGGGADTFEQNRIFSYLKTYMDNYSGTPFGGLESYYQKLNSGLISNSGLTVTDHINDGLGLIHFFGHSSANIFDVDIQEPYNYNNYHKYPMIIAYGCYGGDFTVSGKSFGERFILEEDRGGIAYFANSTAGYLVQLGDYGKTLYPFLYDSLVGQPIGTIIQRSIGAYQVKHLGQNHRNHAKQLNLQGDPSLSIYSPAKSDLEITNSSFFITPENYSASDDSFTVNVITHNLGLADQDSFVMKIRQLTPLGTWIDHPLKKYPSISVVDTLKYVILNTIGQGITGLNDFDVFVDSENAWDELDENNNRLIFKEIIPGNSPAILFPYDYAVVDSQSIKLKASSYVIGAKGVVNYIFEIDTVPEFGSKKFRASGVISGSASYAEWQVPFDLEKDQVYYWRVRLEKFFPAAWAKASFKYIESKTGWAQSHPPQFFNDPVENISMSTLRREWEFEVFQYELHAFIEPGGKAEFRLNNGQYSSRVDPAPAGVFFLGIDQYTLEPYQFNSNTTGLLGDWHWVKTPDNAQMISTAINELKHGDYFLMMNNFDPQVANWPPHIFNSLADIGASTALSSLPNGKAFIIFGRKGYPRSAMEILSPNKYNSANNTYEFDLLSVLKSSQNKGQITSTLVGPATKWTDLIWDWRSLDPSNKEHTRVDVIAQIGNGTLDSLVYSNVDAGSYSLGNLNADKWPYLRLEASKKDSIYRTAPQLDNWHVIYDAPPDAALDPFVTFNFQADTLEEGQELSLKLHCRNVSTTDFLDSMLVRFTLIRDDRSQFVVGEKRYEVLLANTGFDIEYSFETLDKGLSGKVELMIEVNPDFDQPEQYHFNNLFVKEFVVRNDVVNPILDVTFDGKHIMDGDIVSPNPEIIIQVNDENQYLAVNDTAFELYFGSGDDPNSLQRIFLKGNSNISFNPAEIPGENRAGITFKPTSLADGEYMLKAQGYDYKGNLSGSSFYEIHFEVINESSISQILNYPNPFSSSTRFVYTLTGNDIPERFDIQIFTISGRLVKVIDLLAMGEVKLGYNITDYSWDGRDEYGDLLANGVYIYKTNIKINKEEMKVRDEGIDQYFKNGYGKLYIMR